MARKKGSIGTVIGSALVGLDYMIMRATKPPAEQVESRKPPRAIAADDGGTLDIGMPELEPPRSADGDGPAKR